jgi:hypothetical protein
MKDHFNMQFIALVFIVFAVCMIGLLFSRANERRSKPYKPVPEPGYVVDGVRMTGSQMYDFALKRYGHNNMMLTISSAALVLRWNGHEVSYVE